MSEPVKTTEHLVAEAGLDAELLPVEEVDLDEIEAYENATPVDTMWVPSPEGMA